jgi:transposase-like protein
MPPTGHQLLTFRRVASTTLLVPGNRRDLGGLLRLLGQPCDKQTFEVVMRKLARRGVLTMVLRILGTLSTCLDEHQVPIDYQQRRRRLFGSVELLPEALWKACCTWAGVPSTRKRYGYAHRYILELLTGSSDTPQPPLGYLARGSIAGYTAFCAGLPPALTDRLRAVAEQLLADNRLHEPLTWEAPFDWVDAHQWPGPHVDSIQPAVLRSLLLDEQRSLAEAATALETSVDHLCLVLARHPIGLFPERQARPGRRRWRIRPATLTPERVAHLYQECGWSYTRIARQEGVGPHLVGKLARLAGVRTRSLGKPETYGIDVDWLAEQYLVRQRTIADIAAELGLAPRTVSWVTRRQGLMRYSLTAGGSILNDGRRPFACAEWIRPAFSRRGALLRVQRFLALIEYPTYREAAKVLGINQTRLSNQVQQLERDLKVALLVRSNRSANQPLRLTNSGHRFVRDAKTALTNLQGAYAGTQPGVAARRHSGDEPADLGAAPGLPERVAVGEVGGVGEVDLVADHDHAVELARQRVQLVDHALPPQVVQAAETLVDDERPGGLGTG